MLSVLYWELALVLKGLWRAPLEHLEEASLPHLMIKAALLVVHASIKRVDTLCVQQMSQVWAGRHSCGPETLAWLHVQKSYHSLSYTQALPPEEDQTSKSSLHPVCSLLVGIGTGRLSCRHLQSCRLGYAQNLDKVLQSSCGAGVKPCPARFQQVNRQPAGHSNPSLNTTSRSLNQGTEVSHNQDIVFITLLSSIWHCIKVDGLKTEFHNVIWQKDAMWGCTTKRIMNNRIH